MGCCRGEKFWNMAESDWGEKELFNIFDVLVLPFYWLLEPY